LGRFRTKPEIRFVGFAPGEEGLEWLQVQSARSATNGGVLLSRINPSTQVQP
jgi:hypothetical protein